MIHAMTTTHTVDTSRLRVGHEEHHPPGPSYRGVVCQHATQLPAFAGTVWDTWTPAGWYQDADFLAAAAAFDNDDWPEVTAHSYSHRWRHAAGAPAGAGASGRLAGARMRRLNVVGTGRVGQTLARLWHAQGLLHVQDLLASRPERAAAAQAFIGSGRVAHRLDEFRPADLWMLTVPDTQIGSVAAELAQALLASGQAAPALVFHCSGFLPAAALAPLQALGWAAASVHPVLSFASPEASVARFAGTPCGVEGDLAAIEHIRPLFEAIGGQCFEVHSEHKPLYHGAAVMASNFLVVLQAMAREAWQAAGVPAALVPQVNEALVRATVDNTLALGPARAIVGPAARGDTQVVQQQGDCIAHWHPEAGCIYREMSVLARRLAVTGRTLPDNGA